MPIITQLVAAKRSKDRVNVYLDGEYALQIHIDLVHKYLLKKGTDFNESLQMQVKTDSRKMTVRSVALNFASYAPRTEWQVRKKLRSMDYEDEECDNAVAFLKEFGYLDDRKFAGAYIRDALSRRATSSGRLRQDLRKRGVRDEDIAHALQTNFPHDRTMELARAAAQKKLRAIDYKTAEKKQRSLRDYLIRQGFDFAVVRQVCSELLKSSTSTAEDADELD